MLDEKIYVSLFIWLKKILVGQKYLENLRKIL